MNQFNDLAPLDDDFVIQYLPYPQYAEFFQGHVSISRKAWEQSRRYAADRLLDCVPCLDEVREHWHGLLDDKLPFGLLNGNIRP